jgi:hypothetical protein
MRCISVCSCYLFIVLLFSSCSPAVYDFELAEITPLPQPLFERLPLSVLVYFGEDFAHYTTTHKNTSHKVTSNIELGSFNADLFSYLLPTVFEEVQITQEHSSYFDDINRIDVDLLIEPTILAFDYWRTANFDHIRVLYKLNFLLPDGEHIGSWDIRAHNSILVSGMYSKSDSISNISNLTQTAAREIAAKFIINICKQKCIEHISYPHCSDEIL